MPVPAAAPPAVSSLQLILQQTVRSSSTSPPSSRGLASAAPAVQWAEACSPEPIGFEVVQPKEDVGAFPSILIGQGESLVAKVS